MIRNNLVLIFIVLLFSIILITTISKPIDLDREAYIVIIVFFITLFFWISKITFYSITGILALVVLYLLGIDSFSSIFSGFSSQSWFFLLSVLILGEAILKTNIGKKSAIILLKITKGKKEILALIMPFLLVLSALFIPSGSARTTILSPILLESTKIKNFNFNEDDGFVRFLALNLGMLNPVSSLAFLSGGASTIIAAEIMNKYGVFTNWFSWCYKFFLPITFILIVSSYLLFFIYKFLFSSEISVLNISSSYFDICLNFRDIYVIVVIIIVIIFWIIGSYINISNAIPPLLGIVLLYLPKLNICDENDLKNINWDLILFFGISISFANLIISTGAGEWFARYIVLLSKAINFKNLYLRYFYFILLSIIRLFFPSLTTFFICILPAIFSSALVMGISLSEISLVAILSGSVTFFPIQTVASLIMFEKKYFKIFDTVICGLILFFSNILLITIIYYFF